MKIIDVGNPNRVNRPIKKKIEIFSGSYFQKGFKINKVELRLYKEKEDPTCGAYCLITSYVETDQGSIEMIYDEGYEKLSSLEETAQFLTNQLGISGLILRSIISLADAQGNN